MHQIMVGNTWEFHQIPLNDVVYLLLDQLDCVKKMKQKDIYCQSFLCIFTACMIIIDNIKVSNIIFVLKKRADKVCHAI